MNLRALVLDKSNPVNPPARQVISCFRHVNATLYLIRALLTSYRFRFRLLLPLSSPSLFSLLLFFVVNTPKEDLKNHMFYIGTRRAKILTKASHMPPFTCVLCKASLSHLIDVT